VSTPVNWRGYEWGGAKGGGVWWGKANIMYAESPKIGYLKVCFKSSELLYLFSIGQQWRNQRLALELT